MTRSMAREKALSKKLDAVLANLGGVTPSGDGYVARCPAHDDRQPSLSVTAKNGRILVHCFAGCTWRQIRLALLGLGIQRRDLVAR